MHWMAPGPLWCGCAPTHAAAGALMRMALDQFAYAPVFIASMMAILLVLDVSPDSRTRTGCCCCTLTAAGCAWWLCQGTLLAAAVHGGWCCCGWLLLSHLLQLGITWPTSLSYLISPFLNAAAVGQTRGHIHYPAQRLAQRHPRQLDPVDSSTVPELPLCPPTAAGAVCECDGVAMECVFQLRHEAQGGNFCLRFRTG